MLALVLFAAWNVVAAAAQNKDIQKELDALYKKHGKRPNKIHFMWDDNSFGEISIPTVNKICGFDTPRLNKTGQEEITFTRMYTDTGGCTHRTPGCSKAEHTFSDAELPLDVKVNGY